ncbi:molecular chaperone IbpA [Natronocella acetinitrilica]|uniref:Molecular chaperone IbpA n=1 Tax=Natronocella acetinitrilica TaxID=414046 RepID=A0AAE3G1V8_9GAMM|nr:Hsp20 family protein [Natronocella acetinitrilica]MCP1674130.1 molecular chaperone IbpA [Natronocella acetinitrilica]
MTTTIPTPASRAGGVLLDGGRLVPMMLRSAIGFADDIEDAFGGLGKAGTYPPYDIIREESAYRIDIAVAGFREEDLEIEVSGARLRVSGRGQKGQELSRQHQGIARRDFILDFRLGRHVQVTGASLALGILSVALTREIPESERPRRISIAAPGPEGVAGKASEA